MHAIILCEYVPKVKYLLVYFLYFRILSRNITVLRNRDLQKAIDIVLRSGKNSLAVTEYIRTVLAGINGK